MRGTEFGTVAMPHARKQMHNTTRLNVHGTVSRLAFENPRCLRCRSTAVRTRRRTFGPCSSRADNNWDILDPRSSRNVGRPKIARSTDRASPASSSRRQLHDFVPGPRHKKAPIPVSTGSHQVAVEAQSVVDNCQFLGHFGQSCSPRPICGRNRTVRIFARNYIVSLETASARCAEQRAGSHGDSRILDRRLPARRQVVYGLAVVPPAAPEIAKVWPRNTLATTSAAVRMEES